MAARLALYRWPDNFRKVSGFPVSMRAHWNLVPKSNILIFRQLASGLQADLAFWGFTPPWMTDFSRASPYARVETLPAQPMFEQAFQQQRCVIPVNGFFEWRGKGRQRHPFWLQPAADQLLYLAGVWTVFNSGSQKYLSVALITQQAAYLRRPVMLTKDEVKAWLSSNVDRAFLVGLLDNNKMPQLYEKRVTAKVADNEFDGIACLSSDRED